MKVFPAVVLVLLAFTAFFVTFLIAPLAVLTTFYVGYVLLTSSRSGGSPAQTPPEPQARWGSEPETELEPVAVPARRARITVASRSERAAAAQAAADEAGARDADDAGEPAAAAGTRDAGSDRSAS